MNLKEIGEGCMGQFEGRKGWGKCDYIKISKMK